MPVLTAGKTVHENRCFPIHAKRAASYHFRRLAAFFLSWCIQLLSDFFCDCLCQYPLRLAIIKDFAAILQSDTNRACNIKFQCGNQFVVCGYGCCALNVRYSFGYLLLRYPFRYRFHFFTVFCAVSPVSVLCPAVFHAAIVIDSVTVFSIRVSICELHCLSSLSVAGYGFGICWSVSFKKHMPQTTSFFELTH